MTTTLKLPPSDRDFNVYLDITTHGLSTRAAADRHHVSQTRVRQIVRRVLDWTAATLPEKVEADKQRELWLAQNIAADRLHLLYGDLMSDWRARHEPRTLGQLLRVNLATTRIGALPGQIEALFADALEPETCNLEPETLSPPPPRDCSPQAPASQPTPPAASTAPTATSSPPSTYAPPTPSPQPTKKPAHTPPKPLLTSLPPLPITQLHITPDAPAEVTLESIRRRRQNQNPRTRQGSPR